MSFLGHALLVFVAGFAQYLLSVDKGNNFGVFLMLALPIIGVYFLGWWALVTYFIGLMIGAKVFVAAMFSKSSE
jgi:hypothetical protein